MFDTVQGTAEAGGYALFMGLDYIVSLGIQDVMVIKDSLFIISQARNASPWMIGLLGNCNLEL